MKIRIRGNSIRLRLMQTEVKTLHEQGNIQEAVDFPNGERLIYRLCTSDRYDAAFRDRTIRIDVPRKIVSEWMVGDELSLGETLRTATEEPLRILIEKDLKCLTKRPFEDESDAYPNPNETC